MTMTGPKLALVTCLEIAFSGMLRAKRRFALRAFLIAFMAAVLPIEAVASAADIMFLLLFIQVLVVLIALRKKRPDLKRGFRVPWVPLVPVVGMKRTFSASPNTAAATARQASTSRPRQPVARSTFLSPRRCRRS